MKKIEQIVRQIVRDTYGLKLAKIKIVEDADDDGDVVLRLDMVLANGTKTFKKGDDYFIIGDVGRKIRDSGEKRYPLFSVQTPDEEAVSA